MSGHKPWRDLRNRWLESLSPEERADWEETKKERVQRLISLSEQLGLYDDHDDIARIVHLTADEWREMVDGQTQRLFGISRDEFIRNYRAGMYRDWDEDRELSWLVMLLGDELEGAP